MVFRMLFDDVHHNNICDSDEAEYDLSCYNVRQVLRTIRLTEYKVYNIITFVIFVIIIINCAK
jgi:hypothetical protein